MKLILCKQCSVPLNPTWQFCAGCGAKLNPHDLNPNEVEGGSFAKQATREGAQSSDLEQSEIQETKGLAGQAPVREQGEAITPPAERPPVWANGNQQEKLQAYRPSKEIVFLNDLDDGHIEISNQMKRSYRGDLKAVGYCMLALGGLLFASGIGSFFVVEPGSILDEGYQNFVFTACFLGPALVLCGTLFAAGPSRDGTTSALTVFLGTMLSASLTVLGMVLFAVFSFFAFIAAICSGLGT